MATNRRGERSGGFIDRKDVGSWLGGPSSRIEAPDYPGEKLGMPRTGPGSMASLGQRVIAVCIDWALCVLIAYGIFKVPFPAQGARGMVPLAIFAVENLLLVGTLGTTIGHKLVGIRVEHAGGGMANPVQVLVRTLLLCLFIPAVVTDENGRGLHDRAANTVIVKTR